MIDLLWRGHPDAPRGGARGPRARLTTEDAVTAALATADAEGLSAVTIRRLARSLGVSTMSVYTYVSSREDLLVLMVDAAHRDMTATPYTAADWRMRLRYLAEDNLRLLTARTWLLDVDDPRAALGPGTIAKYDRELHAFDGLGFDDVDRDAALSFVLDFVSASARTRVVRHVGRGDDGAAGPEPAGGPESTVGAEGTPGPEETAAPRDAPVMAEVWAHTRERLATYLGADHPLAQRVGSAAGEAMNDVHDVQRAWEFGMARMLDGLAGMIADRVPESSA
nr:TetR/AcrR family transcriptional regulator [Gordonia desulfuricans]